MPARGFTLIELLVCVAIIAVLLSLLLPSLGAAAAEGRAAKCASNLRQLGYAFHMYAGDYLGRCMPLAYTATAPGSGPDVYWWGTNDEHGVDHTRGFVWPYLQSDLRHNGVYECPQQPWGTYLPQGAARQVTSTYGYNGYFLCPPHTPGWAFTIGRRPWQNLDTLCQPQRVSVFGDTAIDLGAALPYNNALLDPPYLFNGRRWVVNPCPTTCFRHRDRAALVLADGHAEHFRPGPVRPPAPRFGVGSVGEHNDPYYVPNWREW